MTLKVPKIILFFLTLIPVFLSGKYPMAISEGGPERGEKIRIEKEWKGLQSGYTFPSKFIIETEVQWEEVWDKIHRFRLPRPELPKIDFETEMVIAVFMGVQKSGSYDIRIVEILQAEKEIRVMVRQREPSPDTVQTTALTQPYHVVVIEKSPLPIRFILS